MLQVFICAVTLEHERQPDDVRTGIEGSQIQHVWFTIYVREDSQRTPDTAEMVAPSQSAKLHPSTAVSRAM